MKRTTLSYDGFFYPAIEIEAYKIDKEANEIDNLIYYYCDSGFCYSGPTEEQVIEYFKKLDL